MMGYVPEEKDDSPEYNYEDYIQSKLESFEVLKSISEAEQLADVLSTLDETQYLAMLNDQALIEKALNKLDKQSPTQQVTKSDEVLITESDTSKIMHEVTESEVSVSKSTKTKEELMTTPNKETVEKSALEALQKSLDENKVQLTKALETIAVFEQEKKAQIVKSKTAQFQAVLSDEKILAPVLKAALALESDEDFTLLLGAVTAMQAEVTKQKETLEKSALFTEQGATVSNEEKSQGESAVARILKAKQTK
jgi:hypothetical protein